MAPRTLDARFRLVTPAFISGAQDGADRPAELRVPSLLGVLRFWWRALEWGGVIADYPPAEDKRWQVGHAAAVAELRKREDRLFGAAGKGQGLVLARLVDVQRWDHADRPANGAAYLAGQGLKGRGALAAGTTFTLRFTIRPRSEDPLTAEELASLARALRCLGLLGGIGSRSRHGYGSLVLESLEGEGQSPVWQAPHDRTTYEAALRALNDGHWSTEEPPFTTFSSGARLCLVQAPANTSMKAFMEEQGHVLQHFRSKGAQDATGSYKVNGEDARDHADHPFKDDFAWFDSLVPPGAVPSSGPIRAMFGLPHNYFSRRRSASANVGAVVPSAATGGATSDRRASPLFLHVHKLGNGRLVAAWLFLPALFLPDAVSTGPRLKVNKTEVNFTPDWWPITTFFDEVLATQVDAVTVLP